MLFYYDITVVNRATREVKSVPVNLDLEFDCSEGEDRVQVVNFALERAFIKKEDVEHICEVENMSETEYWELIEYNRNKSK